MALLSSFSFSFTTVTLPRTQTPFFYHNYTSPKIKIPNLSQSNTLLAFSASKLNDQIASNSTPEIQHEIQTRTWNWRGYSIRYQCAGNEGPALVLVHGFGANSDHWRKNIPVLAKFHRVYSIDLIGYGYSDKPNPPQIGDDSFYTFDTWATQLNDFCLDVVKDQAFFVCNSIGGVVGLQAAVVAPQICRGIIVLNISLRMLHIKKQPWYAKPFIRSFQRLLRDTAVGKFFFKAVATKESVRNILSQVLLYLSTQPCEFKNLCFKDCWVDKLNKMPENETLMDLQINRLYKLVIFRLKTSPCRQDERYWKFLH